MPDPSVSLLWATFLIVLGWILFWPRSGVFWRWQHSSRITTRVFREDALKHIHQSESLGQRATISSVAGALNIKVNDVAALLGTMESQDLLKTEAGEFHLTHRGSLSALHIIRAHRLWEGHLANETGFIESEWHDPAERIEHTISTDVENVLSAKLGNPTFDSHGDPTPTSGGEVASHGGIPITSMDINKPLQIVRIEDEPEAIYAQLVAEGLHLGMEVRVTDSTQNRLRLWAGGDEHIIAPIVAANIFVVPLPALEEVESNRNERLSSLQLGEHGSVVRISAACRGLERRRLMDLGILPGTIITAEMQSPSGDPTAYRIRDAVIALRREQADLISVTRSL